MDKADLLGRLGEYQTDIAEIVARTRDRHTRRLDEARKHLERMTQAPQALPVVIENARRTLARLESDVGLPLLDQEVADAIQASLPQRQQNLMRVLAILNDIPGSQGLASEDPIADSMRVVVHDALDDLLYCQDEPFDDPEATLQVRDEALSELERRFPRMARTIGE